MEGDDDELEALIWRVLSALFPVVVEVDHQSSSEYVELELVVMPL
jgi:hypothetical protein